MSENTAVSHSKTVMPENDREQPNESNTDVNESSC